MTSFKQILGTSALALCLSAPAFAQGTTAPTTTAPTTTAPQDAPGAPSGAMEAKPTTSKAMSYKAAKNACKAEGVKGKDLKPCIAKKKAGA